MIRKNPSGDLPQIAESAYVDKTAIICGKVVIGENVFVGPYAVGWIKDATGNFTYGLLVLAGAVLATGVAALMVGHSCTVEHGEPTPAPAPAT